MTVISMEQAAMLAEVRQACIAYSRPWQPARRHYRPAYGQHITRSGSGHIPGSQAGEDRHSG